MAELRLVWDVLRPGGVVFGDDYDVFWPGVTRAVDKFARLHMEELEPQMYFDDIFSNFSQPIPGLIVDRAARKANQWILFRKKA